MTIEEFFSQVQRPVGQGGFQTGWIYHRILHSPHGPVVTTQTLCSWVYDCGSNQLAALTTEIKKVCGVRFNFLFLSHLDGDHVVGVDQLLLTASGVDQVVLPYLGDEEWALCLAAAASNGTLTGSFVDFAADPAGWLGSRGVDRIAYVEAVDEGDDAVSGPDRVDPDQPPSDRRGEELLNPEDDRGSTEAAWSRPPRVVHKGDKANSRAEVVVLERGTVATVRVTGRELNWVLSPFAVKPAAKKMLQFRQCLEAHFGVGLTAKEYAAHARSLAGRASLRNCYDLVWKNHNLHSMALYSGPARISSGKIRNTARHGSFVRRMIQPGWISTGDFDARVKNRRDALLRYYSGFAPMVGQIALPHHGSDLSFDTALLDAFPDLSCAIAPVGANSYGHPGLAVQAAVAMRPSIDFVRVDESGSSVYTVAGPIA